MFYYNHLVTICRKCLFLNPGFSVSDRFKIAQKYVCVCFQKCTLSFLLPQPADLHTHTHTHTHTHCRGFGSFLRTVFCILKLVSRGSMWCECRAFPELYVAVHRLFINPHVCASCLAGARCFRNDNLLCRRCPRCLWLISQMLVMVSPEQTASGRSVTPRLEPPGRWYLTPCGDMHSAKHPEPASSILDLLSNILNSVSELTLIFYWIFIN